MKIKEILSQYRRAFVAIFECEHCKTKIELKGYDDVNFHQRVIPNMICEKCGKKAKENYRPLTTKYQDNAIV